MRLILGLALMLVVGSPVAGQENARQEAERRAKVLSALPSDAAKRLFFEAPGPSKLAARAIGSYARGCIAGARALPVNGASWQVMRLTRNRNWGHPALIGFLERFAGEVPRVSGWPGLLVGDLGQPRGGPMLTGHASHQLGLDADIWLTPMPRRLLSPDERENMSAVNVVAGDWNDVDPRTWTADHLAVIRAAARSSDVARVLVNPAIKRALCREAGTDRAWLKKVRPWWGHNYHMHVRVSCPADSPQCREQDAVPGGEGCGPELDWWFREEVRNPKPKPKPPGWKPPPPPKPWTLADLPPECRQVLYSD